ncbi:hypothetical protein CRENBAI_015744 [Crenichthys baileyi]|uniref:Uncharacterized protein n=1 Tax=Crenichthys baileyi TaxID=28760 RepID=A0AAV9S705_9TELE
MEVPGVGLLPFLEYVGGFGAGPLGSLRPALAPEGWLPVQWVGLPPWPGGWSLVGWGCEGMGLGLEGGLRDLGYAQVKSGGMETGCTCQGCLVPGIRAGTASLKILGLWLGARFTWLASVLPDYFAGDRLLSGDSHLAYWGSLRDPWP